MNPRVYALEILEAVKQALSQIAGMPPVLRRKRHVFRDEGEDGKSVILINLIKDELAEQDPNNETFLVTKEDGLTPTRWIMVDYTIRVTLVYQQNDQYEEDPVSPLLWRQQIRNILYQPTLPGAPSIVNCGMQLGEIYDGNAMEKSYDSEELFFIYRSVEQANGEYPAATAFTGV